MEMRLYDIDDPEVDSICSTKIRGFKLIHRMRKHVGKSIPPLPDPLTIIPQSTISKVSRSEELKEELVSAICEVFDDFPRGKHIATMRMATFPSKAHLPNLKINLRAKEKDIARNVENVVETFLKVVDELKPSVIESNIYFHPWIEPLGLGPSCEVSLPRQGGKRLFNVTATWGCGYGLEWGGDKYVVDMESKRMAEKQIGKKEWYFRVEDPVTGEIHDPPMKVKVPTRMVGKPVLSDDEVMDLCSRYSPLEKRPPFPTAWRNPVSVHWTRWREGEDYTIDFMLYEPHLLLPSTKQRMVLRVVVLSSPDDLGKVKMQPKGVLYVIKPSRETRDVEDLFRVIFAIEGRNNAIASYGGMLSHPAILARERGIPYIPLDPRLELKDGDVVEIERGRIKSVKRKSL